ncbi:MAG: hypothetical protein M3460_13630 [Actinomycetota bacterium]|nr:hypothetical protein [Actinomycetota bacterium]
MAIHRCAQGRQVLLAASVAPIRVDVLDRVALLDAVAGRRCDAVISQ